MSFLQKYMLLLFLLVNLTAEYWLLMSVSKVFFYIILALSIPVLLFKSRVLNTTSIKVCPHLYWMGGIYLLYQFTLGIDTLSKDTILYLIGKLVTFCIIIVCVKSNFEFYFKKTIQYFTYIIFALLVLGWLFNRYDYGGHISYGFVNRNAGAAMVAIAFAGFLFGTDELKRKDWFFIIICFIAVLYAGSRNCLAMCILFMLVRFGFSAKLVSVFGLLAFALLVVFPEIGIEVTAFERLADTVSGKLGTDRENQRDAALWMIETKPITGWGFGAQMQGHAAELSILGSHNGYLDHLIYMGLPFGGMWIFVLFLGAIKRLRLYFLKNRIVNYHIAVMVSILFAANQEAFLIGVNQITTNLFFVSFTVLGAYIYQQKFKVSR